MLRKLVLWFLLLPLPLNGLWMACDDASGTDQAPALTQEQKDCIRICALKLQAADGLICLILPGDAKTSISIVNYGVAVAPAKIELSPMGILGEYIRELPLMYSAPSIFNATPPPRA